MAEHLYLIINKDINYNKKMLLNAEQFNLICSSLYLFPIGILLAGKILGVPLRWLGNFLLLEALAGNY